MIKSIVKVLYISFSVILAFLIYMMGYNTNAYDYINGITSEAISEKDYVEVAKIHGGCFETVNVVTATPELNKNNYELAVFKSGTLLTTQYKDSNDETVEENEYVYSYYVFLFGLTSTLDASTDGTNVSNETAFKFVGTEGEYVYYFKLSSVYNSKVYNEKPTNVNEALLGSERDLFSNQTNWGFVNLTLSETLLNAMNIGNVTEIQVTNEIGEVVFVQDVALDFNKEEGFFSEIKPLVENYNEYIEVVTNEDAENADITEAEDKFNKFYLEFEESFLSDTNNSFRHKDEYLQPSKIIWETIGLLVLYALGVVILYILLFNFSLIKRIFVKNSYSTDYGTKAVQANKKNKEAAIDAEVKVVKESVEAELNNQVEEASEDDKNE